MWEISRLLPYLLTYNPFIQSAWKCFAYFGGWVLALVRAVRVLVCFHICFSWKRKMCSCNVQDIYQFVKAQLCFSFSIIICCFLFFVCFLFIYLFIYAFVRWQHGGCFCLHMCVYPHRDYCVGQSAEEPSPIYWVPQSPLGHTVHTQACKHVTLIRLSFIFPNTAPHFNGLR